MSSLDSLIEQHQAYLHLQRRISKAIHNRDERLLVQLRQASHELFGRIEVNKKSALDSSDSNISKPPFAQSSLTQLAQLIEQAQQQVQENENDLKEWLGQMKADIQHYRASQSKRGVLASYTQHPQVRSHHSTEVENLSLPVEEVESAHVAVTSAGPWMTPTQDPKMVGRQINQQS